MKILKLDSRNVKRLRAVEITPRGAVIIVGGKNGQGKSSVLDSIAYALGGKELICSEPVRRGEEHAEVTCDLGEFIVRRTFTAQGGGQLIVETKDGARFSSPQGKLNELVGRLSFDPLEFSRMEPGKQAETLRDLVGLDFSDLDWRRQALFEQRTTVNREHKSTKARYEATLPLHPGVPEVETPSALLIAELEAGQAVNGANAGVRAQVGTAVASFAMAEDNLARAIEEIDKLQKRFLEEEARAIVADQQLNDARAGVDRARAAAEQVIDVELAPIRGRLAGLETLNRMVRENRLSAELQRELEAKGAEAAELTRKLEAIAEQKQGAIAAAKFPVELLAFNAEGGVTFAGLPFDQASAAEKLRVSVSIGMALNPQLRVLLVRDGSLLDEASLQLLSQMVEAADYQLWLERVEDGGATVIIEDGSVVGAASAEEGAAR